MHFKKHYIWYFTLWFIVWDWFCSRPRLKDILWGGKDEGVFDLEQFSSSHLFYHETRYFYFQLSEITLGGKDNLMREPLFCLIEVLLSRLTSYSNFKCSLFRLPTNYYTKQHLLQDLLSNTIFSLDLWPNYIDRCVLKTLPKAANVISNCLKIVLTPIKILFFFYYINTLCLSPNCKQIKLL